MKNRWKICKCGTVHQRLHQSYCLDCHAEYMRNHRPKHRDLKPDARKKANARCHANVAQKRGQITKPGECSTCGSLELLEKHHPNYDKPLEVIWLCKDCHKIWHSRFTET